MCVFNGFFVVGMSWLGFVAGGLGSLAALSFFFQTFRIVRNRDSRNVSLSTYIILFVTALAWLLYGLSIGDVPLIVSYVIGSVSTFSVIVVYFMYRGRG